MDDTPRQTASTSLKAGNKAGNDRFTLIQELGRGGMGVVWLAHDTHLNEHVALKFLPPEVSADPVALNDLRRETARSHRLTHPNIIRIHDFHQQSDGLAFISMEYVDGPTLSSWRLHQPNQVFTWEQFAPVYEQLCQALIYAHGEGVIHRDLKPGNVMVDSRGRVKLADFGIAAVVTDSMSRVSARSSSGGTLAYMSPQQLAGKMPSAADDIYALGATVYELLTGKPPFFTGDLTYQVLNVPATPVMERIAELGHGHWVPPEVAGFLMACLAKDPSQRPASVAAALQVFTPGTAFVAEPAYDHAPTADGAKSRKALWIAAGAGSFLILALAAGALLMKKGSKDAGAGEIPAPAGSSPLATASALPFTGALQGTIWNVKDSEGDSCWLQFAPNGVLTYDAGRGVRPNGKWQQDGTGVSIDVNEGYTLLSGSISGKKMSGKALSRNSRTWTWEAKPRN